jgi:hypothetical protein
MLLEWVRTLQRPPLKSLILKNSLYKSGTSFDFGCYGDKCQ